MNKEIILNDFISSKTAKNMLYHLSCTKYDAECIFNGFGSYSLIITYFRDKNKYLTVTMIFDGGSYDHKFGFECNGEDKFFNYAFLNSLSDYFFAYIYKYGLIVARCKECKNLVIKKDSNYSEYYSCSDGHEVVLDRLKENCISFRRRGSRIKSLSKSYLTAVSIFGEDVVRI